MDLIEWIDSTAGPVVEVGVGTGAVARPLAELLKRPVVGVDLSPEMLVSAQARLGNVVTVGDAVHLPVRTESVDAIVCVWVLHLVADVRSVLAECARVLRPAGVMAVGHGRTELDASDEIETVRSKVMGDLQRPGRTPSDVQNAANAIGFVVQAEGMSRWLRWEQSPNEEADRIAQRQYATLFDLDDATWEQRIRPTIEALRALPEPDRPRSRSARHPYMILRKPE